MAKRILNLVEKIWHKMAHAPRINPQSREYDNSWGRYSRFQHPLPPTIFF